MYFLRGLEGINQDEDVGSKGLKWARGAEPEAEKGLHFRENQGSRRVGEQ